MSSAPETAQAETDLNAERCRVRVALEAFEGSLDTLITLVRRDEAMLMRIELRTMTGQLLSQAESLGIQDAGIAVVLSAQIVALKAAALRRLAGHPETTEASGEADEEMLVLLLECKEIVRELRDEDGGRISSGAPWVEPGAARKLRSHSKGDGNGPDSFTLEDLDRELGELEREVSGANVLVPDPYPRSRVLGELHRRLDGQPSIGFEEFDDQGPGFRVALFLALLEEVRSRSLLLSQISSFGPIVITRP